MNHLPRIRPRSDTSSLRSLLSPITLCPDSDTFFLNFPKFLLFLPRIASSYFSSPSSFSAFLSSFFLFSFTTVFSPLITPHLIIWHQWFHTTTPLKKPPYITHNLRPMEGWPSDLKARYFNAFVLVFLFCVHQPHNSCLHLVHSSYPIPLIPSSFPVFLFFPSSILTLLYPLSPPSSFPLLSLFPPLTQL